MNREYDYSELIEDYLTGRLSEKQRLEFETQLEKNPDLNKDYMLQKDIISSIKNVRKNELKSMLNSVNVSTGSGFNYFPIQILGAVLITSLLAVGTYYFFSEDEQTLSDKNPVLVEPTPPNNPASEQNLSQKTPADEILNEGNNVQPQGNNGSGESTTTTETTSTGNPVGKKTESELPTSSIDESRLNNEKSTTENIDNSGLNVETKNDRNHAFHYQYYEEKLFLYGDFKGHDYEILKLPTISDIKLYMSYNDRFYKMEKSRKIKAFEPVEDPAIIDQLQKIKTK